MARAKACSAEISLPARIVSDAEVRAERPLESPAAGCQLFQHRNRFFLISPRSNFWCASCQSFLPHCPWQEEPLEQDWRGLVKLRLARVREGGVWVNACLAANTGNNK